MNQQQEELKKRLDDEKRAREELKKKEEQERKERESQKARLQYDLVDSITPVQQANMFASEYAFHANLFSPLSQPEPQLCAHVG